ncbi:MAG: 2Fe-2S iron-sulfur cluster-binding protein, partial [Planctomycetota bacterium]
SGDHALRQEIEAICENHDNLSQVVFYSEPLETDQKGRDFDIGDRMSVEFVKARLGETFAQSDFFLVGPPPFMDALVSQLKDEGVPEEAIKTEAFGPSSVRKTKTETKPATENGEISSVKFDRTGKTVSWDDEFDSLLEFAESLGIEIESGCRSGNCGSCALAVKSGDVEYFDEPGTDVENGTCLPCVSTPKGSIVLDA